MRIFDDPGAPHEMTEEFRNYIADLISRRLSVKKESRMANSKDLLKYQKQMKSHHEFCSKLFNVDASLVEHPKEWKELYEKYGKEDKHENR